ncbi:hypothetical protein KIPE111705_02555 [Kibdelosporangium persicum]
MTGSFGVSFSTPTFSAGSSAQSAAHAKRSTTTENQA